MNGERRLDMSPGSIQSGAAPVPGVPHLYLAYASEDKETLARSLAQALINKGIEVWFDEWEIRTGGSLRRA